jgi:hypothetical protein
MKLLTSQKAEIIKTIVAAGLKSRDFEISEIPTSQGAPFSCTEVRYIKQPEYSFILKEANSLNYSYRVIIVPARESYSDSYGINDYLEATVHFNDWVKYLKRELEAEDMLTNLMKEVREEKLDFDGEEESSFTTEEKRQVKVKVDTLKINIVNLNILPPEQLKLIEGKLDEVLDKMDKMDKSTWKTFCIGTFVAIMASLSLSPERGNKVWHLFLDFMSTQLKLK